MKRIAIVGVGLIGGSLGLALKKRNLIKEVVGIGRRQESIDKALQAGAVDRGTLKLEEGVKDVDLVVIATPVGSITEMIKRTIIALPQRAIITDVGSTKEKIVIEVDRIIPKKISFLGGHPLAGSEKSGVEAAREDLFVDSVCVLKPGKTTLPGVLATISSFWENVGARVIVMKPEEHDFLIAATSHLPHLVSAALVSLTGRLEGEKEGLLPLIATGFKDTTRIALSSPEVWKDIYLTNGKNIISMVGRFQELLEEIKGYILKEEGALLQEELDRVRVFRGRC